MLYLLEHPDSSTFSASHYTKMLQIWPLPHTRTKAVFWAPRSTLCYLQRSKSSTGTSAECRIFRWAMGQLPDLDVSPIKLRMDHHFLIWIQRLNYFENDGITKSSLKPLLLVVCDKSVASLLHQWHYMFVCKWRVWQAQIVEMLPKSICLTAEMLQKSNCP